MLKIGNFQKAIFIIVILTAIAMFFYFFQQPYTGHKIYVANEGDGTISVVNAESLAVIKTIKLSGMPHNVNVDQLGRYAYATNHEGEEEEDEKDHGGHAGHKPFLRIIDAKKDEVYMSIPMPEMAAHVVPSRDGKFAYVSIEGSNQILEIYVADGTTKRGFTVGSGPHGFVLSNDGKMLYAPNMKSNDASIVDLETAKEERIELTFDGFQCETPVAMGITADDKFSFISCGKSFEIYKIDNPAKRIIGRIQLNKGEFPGPIQLPVHPDGKYLYVPDMRNGVVHKIGIEKFELLKDIASGKGAHGIAYSANGKTAYVTNTWENTLSVIDLENETVIKKIPVGSKPNGVAVTSGKNQGY